MRAAALRRSTLRRFKVLSSLVFFAVVRLRLMDARNGRMRLNSWSWRRMSCSFFRCARIRSFSVSYAEAMAMSSCIDVLRRYGQTATRVIRPSHGTVQRDYLPMAFLRAMVVFLFCWAGVRPPVPARVLLEPMPAFEAFWRG